jgi:hypothetical protein
MKKGSTKRLTPEQSTELTALAALPDGAVDTSDAPASAPAKSKTVGRTNDYKIVRNLFRGPAREATRDAAEGAANA